MACGMVGATLRGRPERGDNEKVEIGKYGNWKCGNLMMS